MFRLKNLFGTSPVYLSIACLFSIIERTIKTVFIIQTIDTMLLSQSELTSEDFWYAIYCTGLLSIRYVFAANRHVFAYKAGLETRNNVMRYYHTKWLSMPMIKQTDHQMLLKNISDKIKELVSRLAVDLVPGCISFLVGSYTCLRIVSFPIGIYCIAYILLIEYTYYNASQKANRREKILSNSESKISAKVFYLASDALSNRETVHIYDRVSHEVQRFLDACKYLLKHEMELLTLQNYQNSFLHWMVHLINGGILWMCRGHLDSNSQLVMLLYNVNEIRTGIHEWITFYRYHDNTMILLKSLDHETKSQINTHTRICYYNTIKCKKICFSFGKRQIYQNLSHTFQPGSITALLGTNGAGKTTLFRILLREYEISSGSLELPPKKNILLCEQHPQLFSQESVAYNIAYGCSSVLDTRVELNHKNTSEKYSHYGKHVEEAAHMLDIGDLEDADVQTLSGGEKQKISLARVLAKSLQNPNFIQLLLLDEWDSALDYKSRKLAYEAIQHIRNITRCTTIFITHTDVSKDYTMEFHKECKAIILDKGKIVHHGDFKNIWKEYVSEY